jgi:hypothetical protein
MITEVSKVSNNACKSKKPAFIEKFKIDLK